MRASPMEELVPHLQVEDSSGDRQEFLRLREDRGRLSAHDLGEIAGGGGAAAGRPGRGVVGAGKVGTGKVGAGEIGEPKRHPIEWIVPGRYLLV